ncbi:MAG: hydroxymethylbilane synthase [Sphingomonadaceae bacterium]|uniref:hydroxymethylbilane synthase n=1 Tax=Thermaurantiacus sp. TaxID=2820283 RepID=UPI00298EDA9C|nr:hydroxymethylbilane synthase [Thermaurantiacus sp.]MCS6986479.1 hydroxymethylbilane synthase [Sphingomonadaceae bacterium]MDW8414260.1 hydroxymethylbilane synthase [Thermaurantiacus sp.]
MPAPADRLRLGARRSPLAQIQARLVAEALARQGVATSVMSVVTQGDRAWDRPLAEIGGKSVWTKELDEALRDRRIDAAVHSLKDVETRLPEGIVLAAFLPRADPRDRLVGAPALEALPQGARVGTSSPRRAAQLKHRRPDCRPVPLRGNVATRLGRLADGIMDATFLAAAGLDRLGIAAGTPLPVDAWLPAATQGIVAVAARADDRPTLERLAAIDDTDARLAALAERAVLEALGGTCRTAVAVHARPVGPDWRVDAELLSPDGTERVVAWGRFAARPDAAWQAGAGLGARLLAEASEAIRRSLAA